MTSSSHLFKAANTVGEAGSKSNLPNSKWINRWIFPIAVTIPSIILSLFGISGSSVGAFDAGLNGTNFSPGMLFGNPRAIRSDEYNVMTPLIIHQSHWGFSQTTQAGLGSHNVSFISEIPNWSWTTFFKPWDIPTLLLPLNQGFSARWWGLSLLLLLGVYFLLEELTHKISISIIFSVALLLSPFFQWWYLPLIFVPVAMGSLALYFFLRILRAPSQGSKLIWALASSWALLSFILILYPPIQVPVGLILLSLGCAQIIFLCKTNEISIRQVLSSLILVFIPCAVILVIYYLEYQSILAAITGTVYPGSRRVTGGTGDPRVLLSAPFGLLLDQNDALPLSQTNQSEISSFILLTPFVLLQLFRSGLRSLEVRGRYLLIGCASGSILLFLWYLIGFPSLIARVFLLDLVPPSRAIVGIGFGGFLLMAIYCASEATSKPACEGEVISQNLFRSVTSRVDIGALVCGFLAFVIYCWEGKQLQGSYNLLNLSTQKIVLCSLAAALVILFLSARIVIVGGILLILFGLLNASTVNPLIQGLGPLGSSPVLSAISQISSQNQAQHNQSWISFDDSGYISASLLSSGVPTVNATQPYPDLAFWKSFPGGNQDQFIWNRYSNLVFTPGNPGTTPKLTLIQSDLIRMTIDPCGDYAKQLKIGFVVSPKKLQSACLRPEKVVNDNGRSVYFYSESATKT